MASISNEDHRRASRLIRNGTSFRRSVLITGLRIPMRINVGRARSSNLIARRYLIITFTMESDLFVLTTINRFPRRTKQFPVLVTAFLSGLGPMIEGIRNRAMIRTMASIFRQDDRSQRAQCFLNGNGNLQVRFVGRPINRHRVASNVIVLVAIRMIAVITRNLARSITMVGREDRPVRARTIRVRLFRPMLAIKRRRIGRLILTVIGTRQVPYQVLAASTLVRVLTEVANGITRSFCLILRNI